MDQIPLFEDERAVWIELDEPLRAELVDLMAAIIVAVHQTRAEADGE